MTDNEHPATDEAVHLRDLIAHEVERQLQAVWLRLSHAQAHPAPAEQEAVVLQETAQKDDPLRHALSPLLSVIAFLRSDQELQEEWLRQPLSTDEGEQIQQFLAIASHWDRIERLWDILARRAKENAQATNAQALSLLEFALSVHNRLWVDRFAALEQAEPGSSYNFEIHNGTGQGDRIAQLWLPGLISNTGQRRRKPLVALQA